MSELEGRRAQDGDVSEVTAEVVRAGKRTQVADRYPALHGALARRGGDDPMTIHDAATAAVENKDAGAPVHSTVASQVGTHLGADFSAVRVHQDPLAQQATAAMGARAFAYGGDVFLGPGESGGDLGLMAHELTHVVQQGAAGRRAPQRAVQVGDAASPAEAEADRVSADVTSGNARPSSLLVDDGPVTAGQMLKSQFLDRLRTDVNAAVQPLLGPEYAGVGSPVDQQLNRYAAMPAAGIEAQLRRAVPSAAGARSAGDIIPAVVDRMRSAVETWKQTGQMPAEFSSVAPAPAAAGGPAQAQALRAPDGRETLASLEVELGAGTPLDGGTASRMSAVLGSDVSAARIHTGSIAARKANEAGALAYAIGHHVVMGAAAPGAGTLEGDALLAHELAHVVQQSDAAADPAARRMPIGAESAAAEAHADEAAVGAIAGLTGGKGLAARLGGAFKTGLQLQRCESAATRAHNKLVHLQGLNEVDFRREVGAATRADTETFLNSISPADRATYAVLISRIRNERVIANAEQLEGHLYWAGPSGPDGTGQIRTTTTRPNDTRTGNETNTNDFAVWVRGGAEPTDASRMNCWEMVLYSAYRSGVVPKSWIVQIHHDATAAGAANYHDTLAAALGFGGSAGWAPGQVIPRGNLVFFNGMAHVAISTGNVVGTEHEVMSLWILPGTGTGNFNSVNQRTTVEALGRAYPSAVRHAPSPWR
jgi:cell wall-associated NlpC family hydrolase